MAGSELALPQGYELQEYRIESTLGVGGFGLTYLATDTNLNVRIALKEYLPGDLALRGADRSKTWCRPTFPVRWRNGLKRAKSG